MWPPRSGALHTRLLEKDDIVEGYASQCTQVHLHIKHPLYAGLKYFTTVQLQSPRYHPITAAAITNGLFYLEETALHTVVKLSSQQEHAYLCGVEVQLKNNQCILIDDCAGVVVDSASFTGSRRILFSGDTAPVALYCAHVSFSQLALLHFVWAAGGVPRLRQCTIVCKQPPPPSITNVGMCRVPEP